MEELDPLISVSEAARQISVDKSTLAKQVRQGLVRSHHGKVRLSEVLADRAANIDLSRSKRRDGAIDRPAAAEAKPAKAAVSSADPNDDDEGAPEDGAVFIDGIRYSYADARALKETYLGKLKRLEYETKRARLAPIDEMAAIVDREYASVRERLLAIPGKLAGELDRHQVERLTQEIYEALEELHAEGAAAEAAIDSFRSDVGGEEDGAEAAAPPQPRRMGRTLPLRGGKDQRRPR